MQTESYQKHRRESIKTIKFILKELNLESKINCQKLTESQKIEVLNLVKEACPFTNIHGIRIFKTELKLILTGLGIMKKTPILPINKSKSPYFNQFTTRGLIDDPRSVRF